MNWTAELFDAISKADVARVKASISNGADILAIVDEYDTLTSAVFVWSANPAQQIIHLLIESGANPNLCSTDGTTALHWAAFSDDSELVKILIEAGARVEAEQPEDGDTSLHVASEHSNLKIVKLLLEAGGESALNRFNYVARTPLMWAAEKGNIDIARALIEAGSDVNANDESRIGDTALLKATEEGNFEIVQLLVESGADPTIPGWMGITALSVVRNPTTSEEQRILKLFEKKLSQ